MKTVARQLASGFALLLFTSTYAQSYDAALRKFTEQPSPSVVVVTDQHSYVPGETAWFKFFITDNGRPVTYNSNLYARLISSGGTPIATALYPVAGAVATGSIIIPDTISNGVYYLQLSTTAMLASGRYRLHPMVITRNSRVQSSDELSFEFFPEGGILAAGLGNRVVFRARNGEVPVSVSGKIKQSGGGVIGDLASFHNGFGEVTFIPLADKTYEAEIEWRGSKKVFSLPQARTSGVQLQVTDEKEGKAFQLARIGSSKENDVVVIVAQMDGQVVYEQEAAFEDYPSLKGHLLTTELPSGVLHFAVFDKNKNLLAERLSFIDNGEYRSGMEIKTAARLPGTRARQDVELVLPAGQGFSGSAAVTQTTNGFRDNIISGTLLTSRLAGIVNDPYWYFAGPADSTRKALDQMLITQKSAEVDWKEVLSSSLQSSSLPDFISVRGEVRDKSGRDLMREGRLTFYVEAEDSTTLSYDAPVSSDGSFRLDSMTFGGRAKLFYSYSDLQGRQQEAKILLAPDVRLAKLEQMPLILPASLRFESGSSPDLSVRTGQVKHHDEQVKVLERVTLKNKNRRPTEEVEDRYTTGAFKMQASKTLDNINEPAKDVSMSVVDYIRNRVNEVELTGGGFVNRKTLSMGSATRWAVGLFLDESPVDLAMLRTVRTGDVALVKFFDVGWVGVGSTYPGGALAIYTRRDEGGPVRPQKLDFVPVQGYTMSKKFPLVNYDQKDLRQVATDHRQTLLWDPNIILSGEKKNYNLVFYTSDLRKPLRIVVQGFDATGKLYYEEKLLQ